MSVFGEDECVGGGGEMSLAEGRGVCAGVVTQDPPQRCKMPLQTEREGRGLSTRMKKNLLLLICVQSKNNLPFLSTAHWGRLVKESVSKEREGVKVLQRTKLEEESKRTRGEGGIMMENGAQVGGPRLSTSKKGKRRESPGKDVGQMNLQRVRMSS